MTQSNGHMAATQDSGMPQRHFLRAWMLLALVAIVASACGGGGASSEESLAAIAAAETNEAQLSLSEDLSRSELLVGETGQITSLGDVVTGDRPVLVWYWAPN